MIVLIITVSDNSEYHFVDVKIEYFNTPGIIVNIARLRQIQYFFYQHTKYIWLKNRHCFGVLDDLLPSPSLSEILEYSSGLLEVEEREL